MSVLLKIPGYLTLSEAEERYKVKADTLKKKCQNGKIKGAVKQGKTWFVPSIPNIDPNLPIVDNYPGLNFDSAYKSNILLYEAEDEAQNYFQSKFNSYIYIWEYGYYFVTLAFNHSSLERSYLPLASFITEAHGALRESFLLNLKGYAPGSFALLRKTHENTLKALAGKIKPAVIWTIAPEGNIQKAESVIGIQLKSVWILGSSFAHSNLLKLFKAKQDMDNNVSELGVTYGPQIDEKQFRAASNCSIFWLYVLIKFLPLIFPGQLSDYWMSKQDESAKMMKDYIVSTGGLKREIESIDRAVTNLKKQK
ncbi:MAG: hypothetical protein WCV93_04555 [Candidatus Shapirobacteria bacterium]|jgi:hypothetical protein